MPRAQRSIRSLSQHLLSSEALATLVVQSEQNGILSEQKNTHNPTIWRAQNTLLNAHLTQEKKDQVEMKLLS
jgi:hypothetical protein